MAVASSHSRPSVWSIFVFCGVLLQWLNCAPSTAAILPRLFVYSELQDQLVVGEPVIADASMTYGDTSAEFPALLFSFDFDDPASPSATSSTSPITTHIYSSAGNYVIRVNITDIDTNTTLEQPIIIFPNNNCYRFTLSTVADFSGMPSTALTLMPFSTPKLLCQIEDPRNASAARRSELTRLFYELGERPFLTTFNTTTPAEITIPREFSRDLDTAYAAWTAIALTGQAPYSMAIAIESRGTSAIGCGVSRTVFTLTVKTFSVPLGTAAVDTDIGDRIVALRPQPRLPLLPYAQDACSPNTAIAWLPLANAEFLGGLVVTTDAAFDSADQSLRDILGGPQSAGIASACQTPMWEAKCTHFEITGIASLANQLLLSTSIGLVAAFYIGRSTETGYQFAKVSTGIIDVDAATDPTGIRVFGPTACPARDAGSESVYFVYNNGSSLAVSRDMYHQSWKVLRIPFDKLGLSPSSAESWTVVGAVWYEPLQSDVLLICRATTGTLCHTVIVTIDSGNHIGFSFPETFRGFLLHVHRHIGNALLAVGHDAVWTSLDGGWSFELSYEADVDFQGTIVTAVSSPANERWAVLTSFGHVVVGDVGLVDTAWIASPLQTNGSTSLVAQTDAHKRQIQILGNILFDAQGALWALKVENAVDGYSVDATYPYGLLDSIEPAVARQNPVIRQRLPVAQSVAIDDSAGAGLGERRRRHCAIAHAMLSDAVATLTLVFLGDTATNDSLTISDQSRICRFRPNDVNRVVWPGGFLIRKVDSGDTSRARAVVVNGNARLLAVTADITASPLVIADAADTLAVIVMATNGTWSADHVGMHVVAGTMTAVLVQQINSTAMQAIRVDIVSPSTALLSTEFPSGRWRLYDLRPRMYSLKIRDCPYVKFAATDNTQAIVDTVSPSGRIVYVDLGDTAEVGAYVLPVPSDAAVLPISATFTNAAPFAVSFSLKSREGGIAAELRYSLKPTADHGGAVTSVTLRPTERSLQCQHVSTSTTVRAACPPYKRLQYVLQKAPSVTMAEFLYGNPQLDATHGIGYVEVLPTNYRPPSEKGKNIPLTPNVYNADPSEPMYRDFFSESHEGKAAPRFKQCKNKKNREACRCTDAQRFSRLVENSDCIDRVERVFFRDPFEPRLVVHVDDGSGRESSKLKLKYRLVELNNRKDYCVDVADNIDCSNKDEVRHALLDPQNGDSILWEGDELYHFGVFIDTDNNDTYCKLSTEFLVYVIGAPPQQTTVWSTISLVAVFVALTLFAAYLLYDHLHVRKALEDADFT